MLRDNSPTIYNADYQTNSRTKHSRASSNHFHRLNLKVIPLVRAIDHNCNVSDNDENGESKL